MPNLVTKDLKLEICQYKPLAEVHVTSKEHISYFLHQSGNNTHALASTILTNEVLSFDHNLPSSHITYPFAHTSTFQMARDFCPKGSP